VRVADAGSDVNLEVTRILDAVRAGDSSAAAQLLPVVYDELRALAAARLRREGGPQSLNATGLVHEAYLRLLGPEGKGADGWSGRGHFFAAAAQSMRRILVDRARERGAHKRGGERVRLDLDPSQLLVDSPPPELIDLDAALARLAEEEPEKAELVALRFFGGLTQREAAAVLGISMTTADRHWAYARAWLLDALDGEA
jgi:RNA polymerase sigma factor (TIGR02999 family)